MPEGGIIKRRLQAIEPLARRRRSAVEQVTAFRHQLATGAVGTRLRAPLRLGATSGLTFWPLATALTIVVIEAAVRWRAAHRPKTAVPR